MTGSRIPLLIVDDDEQFATLLMRLTETMQPEMSFAVRWVNTAPKAIEEINRNQYELVLLDNKLPGADGLDVLMDIAKIPATRQPAVIMLTATGDEAIAVQAMKRGAKDYLSKLDLELPALTRAITGALDRRRLEKEVRERNEQLAIDLRLAQEIQHAFLPQQYPVFPRNRPVEKSALRFCHRYLPTTEVGGDFFDVLQISDTEAGVFICDVMGHGLRAALVTAILRGLVEELMPIARDPGRFLTEVNRGLHAVLKQTRRPLFTSAFYLVADIATAQLRYANAGHPSPFHVRRNTGKVVPLATEGGSAALALLADYKYETLTSSIAADDLIVFYTDGLFEVEGRDDELYGEQRLLAAIRHRLAFPAEELFDQLLKEVRHFSIRSQFTDDVCLVGLEIRELIRAAA